jgi:hypothetical protein
MTMKIVSILFAGGALLSVTSPAFPKQPPNLGAVTSAAVSDMSRGYGRAGGLTASQRAQESQRPKGPLVGTAVNPQAHVLSTWSEEVAKRTHMPLAASVHGAQQHPFRAPRTPKY